MRFLAPSRADGSQLDADLRGALREGLTWCAQQAGLDPASCFGGKPVPLDWCGGPADFAAYYDWAIALSKLSGDPTADPAQAGGQRWQVFVDHFAAACSADRASMDRLPDQPAVVTLGEPYFEPSATERILRWLDLEPDNAMGLVALDADELQRARQDISRALAALAVWTPGFYGELVAVVRQLIVVKPSGGQRLTFRGASSFALWGALAGNCQAHDHWWEWVPTLVHEAAHSILFALARHAPLVENDPAERYASPLRSDPRPLDGIYHAAFVSARETAVLRQCLEAIDSGIDPAGSESAELAAIRRWFATTRDASTTAFHDCVGVLERHARFSPSGRDILGSVRREFAELVCAEA